MKLTFKEQNRNLKCKKKAQLGHHQAGQVHIRLNKIKHCEINGTLAKKYRKRVI
jgi:hypothetical protein